MAKKKRRLRGRAADPDADWNEEELDVADVIQQAADLLEKLEEAPEKVWNRAFDYFSRVEEGVKGIKETMESSGRASKAQKDAITNWETGVDKWLEKDDG